MTIGERIIEQRKKLGLTRVQLAQDLDVPHTTLRNYETDQREPGHLMLIMLSKKFGVTTDYLLGMDEIYEENKKSPEPEGSEDEKNIQLIVNGLTDLLVKAGWIADGGDLTDAQLRTLASYVIGLNAYFNGQS
jgi:transcriptional regulator with XRE-family HTH domain